MLLGKGCHKSCRKRRVFHRHRLAYKGGDCFVIQTRECNDLLSDIFPSDKSTLDKSAVSDLLTAANGISGAAAANSAVLASDYGVTAVDLTAFTAAIATLDGMKDAPREAVVDRKVATLSLPAAIAYVRKIYRNELDKMMMKFKKTEPDFYGAYFAARIIIDRTGTHAAKKQPPPPPTK